MKICCLIGTRPEAVKMAPVIRALRQRGAGVTVVATGQHRDLLSPLMDYFGINADVDLGAMVPDQGLAALTSRLLERSSEFLVAGRPDLVIAQGDTTTVMATAMACFYAHIPFAHVEAGLRTGDLQQPFPEEYNRAVVARTARLNFAPTTRARENLLREGVQADTIFVTGNTGIDSLLWATGRGVPSPVTLAPHQRLLLVTLHRRENFGVPLADLLGAIRQLPGDHPDLVILFPVHPNPQVSGPVREWLRDIPQVRLSQPLDYPEMVGALQQAHLVLTDFGGIQEEAVTLGKPVLVARNITERPEGVELGGARLVGTNPAVLRNEIGRLLSDPAAYASMVIEASPYGDGHAGERIGELAIAWFEALDPK